jgi:site-specific DNA recombinase
MPIVADLYLRLSDFRRDKADSFDARTESLRKKAAELGWQVHRIVIENDVREDGSRKPASAWKRVRTGRRTENGRPIYRVERDGWRSVIRDLETGAANAVLAEDLDRTCRDMADLLDLLDAIRACKGNARSLSGSLTLTDGGTPDEQAFAQFMVTMAGKSSADTSRRVSAGRERLAGLSYGGGIRPYGFKPDPDAPQHRKRLLLVDEEAAVLRKAADDILNKRISLKAVAADLRDRRVPTVTGAKWSGETLKDILLNATVTGLTDPAGNEIWPVIIEADVQDRIRDLLAADSREVTGKDGKTYRIARLPEAHGSAPRWLLSGIAVCGVCGGPVKCVGTTNRRAYQCTEFGHVRRNAVRTDERVTARVLALLEREAPHLLKPAPKVTADTGKLRAEVRQLKRKKDDLARLLTEEILTEAGVRKERKRIDARLTRIEAELAASDEADPLPEIRNLDPDANLLEVWDALGLSRQRAVLRLLYTVKIEPVGRRGGNVFDPDSVVMTRKA